MTRGTFIENEARYEAAKQRNIQMNASKTRRAKWLAMPGAERVNAFLFELDEFEGSEDEKGRYQTHPVVRACPGEFYVNMRKAATEWGGLTEKQTAAVLAMIERGEARVAERAKARAEQAAKDADLSGWIGTIGERRVFELTIRTLIEMSGIYGISYLHVCNDTDGNVVVYKGTNQLGERGDTVRVKATVKDHDIRDGVKQTKIARPKEEK